MSQMNDGGMQQFHSAMDAQLEPAGGMEGEIKLCPTCRDIIVEATNHSDHLEDGSLIHKEQAVDLHRSAKSACKICKKIADAIWWNTDGEMPLSHVHQGCRGSSSTTSPDPQLNACRAEKNFTWCSFRKEERLPNIKLLKIFVARGAETRWGTETCILSLVLDSMEGETNTPERLVGDHTGSPECWDVARSWISNCADKHEKCRGGNPQKRWYPTRLIDVMKSNDEVVKLCITAEIEIEMEGQYVTLSHRWGIDDMFMLDSKNLDEHRRGIALRDIPQTFVDAVRVVRRLGIRYLWVDSLCIIQDSHEDWMTESFQMQKVYQCSYLNISAAGPGDSSGTGALFRQRTVDVDWPMWTSSTADGNRRLLYEWNHWRRGIEETPLNLRAWVLQERILAPRILHFGESQLFWECHELEASEMFPSGIPTIMTRSIGKSLDPTISAKRHKRLKRITSDKRLDGGDRANITYQVWKDLVTRYSACGLSNPTDKLVAISGLARQIATMLDDEYIAGLWRSRLVAFLAWQPFSFCKTFRPSVYRAPSWSWASVEGKIRLGNITNFTPLVTVDEVSVALVNSKDSFGQVNGGILKLAAKLMGPLKISDDCVLYRGPNGEDKVAQDMKAHLDDPNLETGNLFCMPLTEYKPRGDFFYRKCLLLKKDSQSDANHYTRWGIVTAWTEQFGLFDDTDEGARRRAEYGWGFWDETVTIL